MTFATAHRFAVLFALALALAACQRETAAPAADTAEAAATTPAEPATPAGTATAPGTDAIETVDNGPLDPATRTVGGVDARAFAGTFSTEGARIEFRADGTYAMTVHAASADADLESTGTWAAEAGGNEVRLDPDDKSEPDRRYAVASKDEIRAIDGGQVLRRDGAR